MESEIPNSSGLRATNSSQPQTAFFKAKTSDRGDTDVTNIDFFKFVKSHTKSIKIPFVRSKKLTEEVKNCIKLWFNIDSLTKKQEEFADLFAKHVPYWLKSAKHVESRMFSTHSGKHKSIILDILLRIWSLV